MKVFALSLALIATGCAADACRPLFFQLRKHRVAAGQAGIDISLARRK